MSHETDSMDPSEKDSLAEYVAQYNEESRLLAYDFVERYIPHIRSDMLKAHTAQVKIGFPIWYNDILTRLENSDDKFLEPQKRAIEDFSIESLYAFSNRHVAEFKAVHEGLKTSQIQNVDYIEKLERSILYWESVGKIVNEASS